MVSKDLANTVSFYIWLQEERKAGSTPAPVRKRKGTLESWSGTGSKSGTLGKATPPPPPFKNFFFKCKVQTDECAMRRHTDEFLQSEHTHVTSTQVWAENRTSTPGAPALPPFPFPVTAGTAPLPLPPTPLPSPGQSPLNFPTFWSDATAVNMDVTLLMEVKD